MSNVNVSNQLYSGCVSGIGRFPVQLPYIAAIQPIVITCPSGNTSVLYLGSSGVSVDSGTEIAPAQGITLTIENLGYIFCVSPSGFTNQIRYLVS